MKKKVILIFILTIIVAMSIFIGYKLYLLNTYKVNINNNIVLSIKYENDINISKENKTKQELQNINYNNIDNVYFILPNSSFYYDTTKDSLDINMVYFENEKLNATVTIKKSTNLYTKIKNNDIMDYKFLSNKNIDEIIKSLNNMEIKNDYRLYESALDQFDNKINLFTSKNKIINNYLNRNIVRDVLPHTSYYKIEGRYDGILFLEEYDYLLLLNSKGYVYSIRFINENNSSYFNINNVKEYLNKVYIID